MPSNAHQEDSVNSYHPNQHDEAAGNQHDEAASNQEEYVTEGYSRSSTPDSHKAVCPGPIAVSCMI